ncbi:hypothetical protein EVG20_g11450, partial [Dentipellis fragilis]
MRADLVCAGQDSAFDVKAHQYWVEDVEDGFVEIGRVKAGTYRLTVYADGIFGDFTKDNVVVKARETTVLDNLKWTAESAGRELWRVGVPDKTSGEFRNGFERDLTRTNQPHKYRIYWGAWDFPTQFPNGVNFTVGKSDWARDWNYVHWAQFGPSYTRNDTVTDVNRWQINFELDEAPVQHAVATFTVQLAGATTTSGNTDSQQGAWPNFNISTYVNDEPTALEFPIYYYQSGSCAVRSGALRCLSISCYLLSEKFTFPGTWLTRGANKFVLELPFGAAGISSPSTTTTTMSALRHASLALSRVSSSSRLPPCRRRIIADAFPAPPACPHIPPFTTTRAFKHLATPQYPPKPPRDDKEEPKFIALTHPVNTKEQRRRDRTIIRRLAVHIWPKGEWGMRGRVVLGAGLLVAGKVLNVQVPFFFRDIIDYLDVPITADSTVWVVCGSVILGYGLARVGAALFGELLNAVFANVGQRAIRTVARDTFEHLLNLDLRFHLSRQTGGLTRAIDRGTKGITFILQAILFRVVPTALEITLVCGILYAVITAITMAAYSWFTVRTTSWRTQFRREANAADNRAATVAVDSLINYEAVKHFNNEKYEIAQYDKHLTAYEKASIKIATSLA